MFPNLKAEMARQGMTIKDLAELLGVSERSLSSKLSGRTEFTFSEVRQIGKMFNCSIDYLFSTEVGA